MKKTLVVTHDYFPMRGGIGRYCYELFRRQSPDSYGVITDGHACMSVDNVRVYPLLWRLKPSWIPGLVRVLREVRKEKFERIFTPNILPLGTAAYMVHRLTGIPYIISLHGLDINLAIQRKRRQAIIILRNATHIICNSQATAQIVASLHVSTPVTVITPAVESNVIDIDPKVAHELEERYRGYRVILSVGRLVRRKGQDMLIQALPEIQKHVPNVRYVIIGNGPEYTFLWRLVESLGLQDSVDILTDVDDTALAAYYKQAELFAMPTRKIGPDVEGFGMVYVTAAYFAKPIVAGVTGGERESIGGSTCGEFVNGADRADVVRGVLTLLQDTARASQLGANAKRYVATLPTWEQQSKKLDQLLS